MIRDLGEVLLQHESRGLLVGRQAVQICQDGFRGESGGLTGAAVSRAVSSVEAAWEEVTFVKRIDQTVRINGITTSDAVWVHVGLASGRTFVFCGKRDAPGATDAANALFEAAKFHADRRIYAELQAGRPVSFGRDVRASQLGIEVRRGSRWSLLRPEDIAGWRVYRATVMIDHDHRRPRLFAQLHLGKLENGETFIELLARLAPDKDTDRFAYRVKGSVWRTSAATHDPRYVSTRTRMMFLCAPLALVALGMVAAIPLRIVGGMKAREREQAAAERRTKVDAAIAEMKDAPRPERPLAEACAGRAAHEIQRLQVLAAPGIDGLPADATPFRITLGHNPALVPDWSDDDFGSVIERVVLARVLPGSQIVPDGTSEAEMHVRLVDAATGQIACEGVVRGHWTPRGLDRQPPPPPSDLARAVQSGLARLAVAGFCPDTASEVCKHALVYDHTTTFAIGQRPKPPEAAPSATASQRPAKKAAPRPAKSSSGPASDEDRYVITVR